MKMVHTWYPSPTITVHLPQNKATVVYGCRHKHTETNPNKTGPVWALLLRKGFLFSEHGGSKKPRQLLPEAFSRPQLLPHMHPGCSIWRSWAHGSPALLEHTSLVSVLYLPVLSLLKSCLVLRKPAGYFLLTSVGSELCPCWAVLWWQPLEEQWQDSF